MEIRAYEAKDKHQVIFLWNECGLVVPQNDPEKDIDRKLQCDPDLFLVGVQENQVIATVMGGYDGHRGWINYLAVKPSARHSGYAQAIMQSVELRLKAKGCPKINLQVRSGNEDVIAFYATLGYSMDNVVGLGKRLIQDV